jgi:DNA polymerase-3 subunit alpha
VNYYPIHKNNQSLVITDETLIPKFKAAMLEILEKGEDLLVFFDTETTGKEPYPKTDDSGVVAPRDRLTEVAFIVSRQNAEGKFEPLNVDGHDVVFQEYINPSRESKIFLEQFECKSYNEPDAEKVNGISFDFLNGNAPLSGTGGKTLPKPAPTFAEMFPFMEDFLCLNDLVGIKGNLSFVGHNSVVFDAGFLNSEMGMYQRDNMLPSKSFESSVSVHYDTMKIMKELFTTEYLHSVNKGFNVIDAFGYPMKPGNSMSYLAYMLDINEVGREEFHGGLLDSKILLECFNGLLEHPAYKACPNPLPIKKPISLFMQDKMKDTQQLPSFDNNQISNGDKKVLNIIQTDASLHEGTGMVEEYIESAVEAGVTEMLLADSGTLLEYISFYEKCKKNDIKPIIGCRFKVESVADISHYIENNKKRGVYDYDNFGINPTLTSFINNATGENWSELEDFFYEKNYSNLPELDKIIINLIALQDKKDEKTTKTFNTSLTKMLVNMGYNNDSLNALDLDVVQSNIFKLGDIKKRYEFDRVVDYPDLIVIANDDDGMQTIRELISISQRDGQYFLKKDTTRGKGEFPLVNMDMLSKHNKGTSILIGDFNDIVGRSLKDKNIKSANHALNSLKNVFPNIYGDFNSKMDNESARLKKGELNYLNITNQFFQNNNIKAIATHHVAFAKSTDYPVHKNKHAILLDQKASSLNVKPNRYSSQHMIKASTLSDKFSNNQSLLINSSELIKNVNIAPVLHKPSLPDFPTPDGSNQVDFLRKQTEIGFKKRVEHSFKNLMRDKKRNLSTEEFNKINPEIEYKTFYNNYRERLEYELKIIEDMNFSGYFLIAQDVVNFCQESGIFIGPGRGSAAGSLVVYSLGITNADPMEHGLIFERFLNPERVEMPDIDIDVDGRYKLAILDYLRKKYEEYSHGFEGGALIITRSTFSAKSTTLGMAKSYDMPLPWAKALAKEISPKAGTTFKSTLEENEHFKRRYDTEAATHKIINACLRLEEEGGRQRTTGVHAGGYIVGNVAATAPIMYQKGNPIAQFNKKDVETAGSVKFDFLGLKTLEKLNATIALVLKNHGEDALLDVGIGMKNGFINMDDFDFNEKSMYALYDNANTTNIFQLESEQMKGLIRRIKPKNVYELTAITSIGRPAALQAKMDDIYVNGKNNPETIVYKHPLIEPILSETFGAILYQEQIMNIAHKVANFTQGQAGVLRKVLEKKKPELIAEQRVMFIDGCLKNNINEELATEIFDEIESFAGYGFNKSHALSYSILTAMAGCLKHRYIAEFTTAFLSIDAEPKFITKNISAARHDGLNLLCPDVNNSEIDYTTNPATPKNILIGFSGIKGHSFSKIINNRKKQSFEVRGKDGSIETKQGFNDMESLLLSVGTDKSVESLVKAGGLDKLQLITANQFNLDKLPPEYKREKGGKMIFKDRALATTVKRELLMAEFFALKDALSNDKKRKAYAKLPKEEKITIDYQHVVNKVFKNIDFNINRMLKREKDLLSSYVTAHPMNIGGIREKLLSPNVTPPLQSLDSMDETSTQVDKNHIRVAGLVLDVDFNRVSKKGHPFGIITLDDGGLEKSIFLYESAMDMLKQEFGASQGREIREGDILSIVGTYKEDKNDAEKVKFGIDFVEFPKFDLKIIVNEYYQEKPAKKMGYR